MSDNEPRSGNRAGSELGQFQKSARANAMSAFPPIAAELRTSLEVRFVPTTEVMHRSNQDRYSITSSANDINVGGTVTPSCLAVW
jgi:hypothetical protein